MSRWICMSHVINKSNKICEYVKHIFSKTTRAVAAFALATLSMVVLIWQYEQVRTLTLEMTSFCITFLLPHVLSIISWFGSQSQSSVFCFFNHKTEGCEHHFNFHWARYGKLNSLMSFGSYMLYVLISLD